MELLKSMNTALCCGVILSTVMSGFAKTTSFIGQPGVENGNLFSVEANWNNGLPVAGDTVIVSSLVEVVQNDLEDASFAQFIMDKNTSADFALKVYGNPITITSTLSFGYGAQFYLDVNAPGNLNLKGATAKCGDCYGTIDVEGNLTPNIVSTADNALFLHGPLRLNGTLNGSWNFGVLKLCSTGNHFAQPSRIWYAVMGFGVDNALDGDWVISFGTAYLEIRRGCYYLYGTRQVANRVETPVGHSGYSGANDVFEIYGPGMLTLNGTADALATCSFKDAISIVWNPVGDYTQTFSNKTHATTGDLTVSNGTMRIASNCAFPNVKKLTVAEGATFDLATDLENSLAGVTELYVDGTLKVASSAGNPFSALDKVRLGPNAKIYLPDETMQIVSSLVITNDVYLDTGTYTSSSQDPSSANTCDFIVGAGSVVMAPGNNVYWKQSRDGDWNDPSNWSSGTVPSAGHNVFITASGGDYDVAFDTAALTNVASITVGNEGSHTSRLVCALGGSITNHMKPTAKFTIQGGGVFEHRSGYLILTNTANGNILVDNGGIWRVTGGTNYLASSYSKGIHVFNGSCMEVTGGRITMMSGTSTSYLNPLFMKDSTLRVAGTGYFNFVPLQSENNPFESSDVYIEDDGVCYIGRTFAKNSANNKPLRFVTKDRGRLAFQSGVYTGYGAGTRVYFDFYGTNVTHNLGWGASIGINTPSYTEMNMYKGTEVSVGGYGLSIGGAVTVKNDKTACFPTGVVNVVGAYLYGSGDYFYASGHYTSNSYRGLVVGGSFDMTMRTNGIWTTIDAAGVKCRLHGELHLKEKALYDQHAGFVTVGMGPSDGIITIDDSTFKKYRDGECVIGTYRGNGLFKITGGGVVELSDRLFVGGFYWPDSHPYTRDFAFYNPAGSRPCGHIEDVSVSTGRFQVVDGTLKMMRGTSFKDSIVVGSMGTGYFDIGSNGVVNASNFTLSNNVMSQLSFKFGKNGIGKINASETFTIASGAKLSIDTTEYAGQKLGFRLVEAGNMVGAFDLDDIEILCTKGLPASCYQDDAGLSVKFFVGTIIMLK